MIVAECMYYNEASGSAASVNDIGLLQQLIQKVEPILQPESAQNHIRWAALSAYHIIHTNKVEFNRLINAFREKKSIEECISIIEGFHELIIETEKAIDNKVNEMK